MAAQWSEHEARAVLSAWRASGVSIERFAAARGIVSQRVRWWKKKLEGGEPARKAATLLPVRVVSTAESTRGTPIQVILPSGHIVRVGRGFDEDTFARVMAILSGR